MPWKFTYTSLHIEKGRDVCIIQLLGNFLGSGWFLFHIFIFSVHILHAFNMNSTEKPKKNIPSCLFPIIIQVSEYWINDIKTLLVMVFKRHAGLVSRPLVRVWNGWSGTMKNFYAHRPNVMNRKNLFPLDSIVLYITTDEN